MELLKPIIGFENISVGQLGCQCFYGFWKGNEQSLSLVSLTSCLSLPGGAITGYCTVFSWKGSASRHTQHSLWASGTATNQWFRIPPYPFSSIQGTSDVEERHETLIATAICRVLLDCPHVLKEYTSRETRLVYFSLPLCDVRCWRETVLSRCVYMLQIINTQGKKEFSTTTGQLNSLAWQRH